MNITIGSDHAGFKIKEKLKEYLEKKGISCDDMGTHSEEPVDYPDYAEEVAKKVTKSGNSHKRGILICGSGTGMVIAANKVKGARAVAAYDEYTARMSREDNDTNILCLRGREFPFEKIKTITDTWLNTPFSEKKRHKIRLVKIRKLEK
ncbi:MAG: ribose 5-phosphate isomerase B [Candidatus Woesearchaeota archaeon]